MPTKTVQAFRKSAWLGIAAALALACVPSTQARVVQIIIDSGPTALAPAVTGAPAYYQVAGRAIGQLNPTDAHNTIITDINLAPTVMNAENVPVVQYTATFVLTYPQNMANASGFMWHDVPNRAGSITIVGAERALGDVGLASGWQADNAGATAVKATPMTIGGSHWVQVPMAQNPDGTPVTGNVLGRIINRSGPGSEPLNVMGNPIPYLPATLDTTQASLTTHTHETINGVVSVGSTIASTDWAFASCTSWGVNQIPQDINVAHLPPAPAQTPPILPVQICLKNGFDPTLLYQVVYPATNAWVLGAGMAAFRDVDSFFRYQSQDDFGTPNPLAYGGTSTAIKWAVIRGVSQSGNFTRAFIHLGFNQDESNRIVHEGAWPIIAGRRVAEDMRWGQPDGVLELYQTGSEGPQWWVDWPDTVRGNPPGSLLDRCNKTTPNTCPKIIEHFGGSEVFALKMTTEWVGTSANADIPLPRNNRRYYVGSTTHGGGNGSYNIPATVTGVNCPGNNWGTGLYGANPVSEGDLVNVLRLAMRNWLMHGTNPPTSLYPNLSGGTLVDPTQAAMGFPSGVPGIPYSPQPNIFDPTNFVNPVFDYNWGPNFNEVDQTGFATNLPPSLTPVIAMKVPKVDADGNELGGVPNVMRDAPFATYLGWNVTSAGFHAGEVCNYIGGMIPFANTQAQRLANGDPRLSLQERYGSHSGYVTAVTAAANNAACKGYLNAGPTAGSMGATCFQASLPLGTSDDWANEVNSAAASNICTFGSAEQSCDPATP
jgi:hypothetical protein